MSEEDSKSPVDWSLNTLETDPLAKALLKNSHLTAVQLATLIIDVFWSTSETASENGGLGPRSHRRRVSKGAFNRSLSQARRNVIRSVYTLFLLAYFEMFDSPKLEPFIRLGNEMKTFLDARRETGGKGELEAQEAMKVLEKALASTIAELAAMGCFKRGSDVS